MPTNSGIDGQSASRFSDDGKTTGDRYKTTTDLPPPDGSNKPYIAMRVTEHSASGLIFAPLRTAPAPDSKKNQ